MNLRSAWVKETGQTREDTRLTVLGAMTPAGPVQARSGILPSSAGGTPQPDGFQLSNATAMSVSIAAGRAVIQGDSSQGAYPVTLPEAFTATIADGNAQFDRIDLVVIRIYDSIYDNSGSYDAVVEVIQGDAVAGAVIPPVTPPLSLPLYQLPVPAGASAGSGGIDFAATATDLRTVTVSLGGILPSYHDSGVPGCYPGQYQDAGSLQRWSGSAWVAYPHEIGGIAPNGALSTGSYVGQYRDGANGVLQRWNGSVWQGAVPAPAFITSLDAGWTTSAVYVTALEDTPGGSFTLTFTAPPSGAVLITLGAAIHIKDGVSATGLMSATVTQGSTVISTGNDDRSASGSGLNQSSAVSTYRVGALVPGTSYTVTTYYRSAPTTSTVGQAWFDNRFIRVDPAV